MPDQKVVRILFCCMGNICRSPTAEGVVRQLLLTRAGDLAIELDSAGTHDYHIGAAPDARAIQAAQRRGIDLSSLRARQVMADDFAKFDWVLAMDEQNLADLRRIAPAHLHSRIKLMMDFVPELGV